jgi:hypothetical protein
MYVMTISFGFKFEDSHLGKLLTALLEPFGSMRADYGSICEYAQILPRLQEVAASWKEIDETCYSQVFEGSNYALVRTPSRVLIEVYSNEITVNFGRDSKNLSQEIISNISATGLPVRICDERWNELYGPKAPAVVD